MLKILGSFCGWVLSKLPRKPVPWTYVSHTYTGLEAGCHNYMVTFARKGKTVVKPFRFHAKTPTPKTDDKLIIFFTQQARVLHG